MPTFTIKPSDGSAVAGITATSASAVLSLVQRLDCKEADVLSDGIYTFSVRLDGTGLWCVFQRDEDES